MLPPAQLTDAVAAAIEAGAMCRRLQNGLDDAARVLKADGSLVTVADYAAQAVVHRRLAQGCDVQAAVGEESPAALAADPALLARVITAIRAETSWTDADEAAVLDAIGYRAWPPHGAGPAPRDYWTVDPIDGTKGFAAGRQYAVCIARVVDGRPVLAVVASPNLPAAHGSHFDTIDPDGFVMAAAEGRGLWWSTCRPGATLEPHPLRTEDPARPPRITFSIEPSDRRREDFDALSTMLGVTRPPAQLDSQAKYAVVARGEADAYYRPARYHKEKVWDHAAGCLLLQESGCTVTDIRGKPINWSNPTLTDNHGILGAPPWLHQRILSILTR